LGQGILRNGSHGKNNKISEKDKHQNKIKGAKLYILGS
jgi:hypothetical protein